MRTYSSKVTSTALAALLSAAMTAGAGQVAMDSKKVVAEPEEAKSLCDSIFSIPTIYKNEDNPYIQKIAFIGRYHGQYYYLDSNQGNADDWDNRRTRVGMDIDFLKKFSFEFNFNLNLDGGRFVEDLEDAILEWEATDELTLSVGKQKAPLSKEWRTSSKRILTFERSRIVGIVVPDKMGGLLASYAGKNGLLLDAGIYTNSVDEDWAYPTFDGGAALFGSVGYKSKSFGEARLDYLYQDIKDGSNQVKPYDNAFSLNYTGTWGRCGLILDGIYGIGAGSTADAYGVVVMPTYDFTAWLKLVVRYQYGSSDSSKGYSLQSRYEREAPDLSASTGDNYQAVYAGLNWYICGDKFKLMAGGEYSTMDQSSGDTYEAFTWLGGVRLYF